MSIEQSSGFKGSGWDTAAKVAAQQEAARSSSTYRFGIKKGESSRVVFIDDAPTAIVEEHFIKIGGTKPTNVVCPGEGCPLCATDNRKSTVYYFTIMERKQIDRDGKEAIVNPIRMLGAKAMTFEYLQRQHEKRDGLVGAVFEVSRSNRQQAAWVGDVWEFEEKISKAEIKKLNPEAKPINFNEELLAPSVEELKLMLTGELNSSAPAASATTTSAPVETEEVEW